MHGNGLPFEQAIAGPARRAINMHMPLPDPGTQAGAGMIGQQLSQNLVQALPCQLG